MEAGPDMKISITRTRRAVVAAKAPGIEAGDYARVEGVDTKNNEVTVRTDDERAVSYDPRRLQGVALYREERAFAEGIACR